MYFTACKKDLIEIISSGRLLFSHICNQETDFKPKEDRQVLSYLSLLSAMRGGSKLGFSMDSICGQRRK